MATRLYFTQSAFIEFSPTYDAGWTDTSEASRYQLANTKAASAIAAGTRVGPMSGTAGEKWLDRQYVSSPLAIGLTVSGTFKGQLMAREYNNGDDVNQIITKIWLCDSTGGLRGVLFAIASAGPTAEFISNASHRNKTIADGDALLPIVALAGDRLVVEIGASNSGAATTPEFSFKWGEAASDLPEDETQTTDGAGWIELSPDLTFVSASGGAPNALMLVGCGV